MATTLELQTAINRFVATTEPKAFALVNGANNETVVIGASVTPTFAKSIKDFQDQGQQKINEFEIQSSTLLEDFQDQGQEKIDEFEIQSSTLLENLEGAYETPALTLVQPASNYALPNPTSGTLRGQRLKYHIKPSAGIDLTIHPSIAIPSDSAITFPKALISGETYIVALEWIGSKWMLTTLIGGGI
jgi:hypothetical protein